MRYFSIRYALATACLVLPGCATGPAAAPDRQGEISLVAASAFYEMVEYLCSVHGLRAAYGGPLAEETPRLGMRGFLGGYDTVSIRAWFHRMPDGKRSFVPWSRVNLERADPKVEDEGVLWLRMGSFPQEKTAVPVRIGPYRLHIIAYDLHGEKDPNDPVPLLGWSIRDFLRRIEGLPRTDKYFCW